MHGVCGIYLRRVCIGAGHVVTFRGGSTLHGGAPVSAGVRYIIAGRSDCVCVTLCCVCVWLCVVCVCFESLCMLFKQIIFVFLWK
jgi:hypothetical protein